jgi:hypothetical protein
LKTQYTAMVTRLNSTGEGLGGNVDADGEDQGAAERQSGKAAAQANLLGM